MPDYFEDADLDEMHVAATHAHHAGFTRVEIDPLHAITLINELKANRRAFADNEAERAKAYALVEKELREIGVCSIGVYYANTGAFDTSASETIRMDCKDGMNGKTAYGTLFQAFSTLKKAKARRA